MENEDPRINKITISDRDSEGCSTVISRANFGWLDSFWHRDC